MMKRLYVGLLFTLLSYTLPASALQCTETSCCEPYTGFFDFCYEGSATCNIQFPNLDCAALQAPPPTPTAEPDTTTEPEPAQPVTADVSEALAELESIKAWLAEIVRLDDIQDAIDNLKEINEPAETTEPTDTTGGGGTS